MVSTRRSRGKKETLGSSSFSDAEEFLEKVSDDEEVKPKPKKVSGKSVIRRTITAVVMICSYLLMLRAGHFYCILVGAITQVELYRELINVRYVEAKERGMPWFRTLQWAWFWLAMLWAYGETMHKFCLEHSRTLSSFLPFTSMLDQMVFIGYCGLFVMSILFMKKGLLKFQISQFMWSFATILLVVIQCKFFASYTLKGLFWFFFPMATVVMNDVSAYFCGITMGRKFIDAPFLTLSPNKTWEGFIGAAVLTVIFSFFFPVLLSKFKFLTCPAEAVYITPFPPALECQPNAVFEPQLYDLNPYSINMQVELLPIQLHGLAYGIFASLIAPFGGFFASAIKRAYELKDFDQLFPGHGGMMDRMDCQLFMMGFTSFHHQYFIEPTFTASFIVSQAMLLNSSDRAMIIKELQAAMS